MKVLYINLDKDVVRREHMERQLKGLGLDYKRVPGIDGRQLTEDQIKEVYDSKTSIKVNKKGLTRGEIGCALSHKKCHEIASQYNYTLILEDDVKLPNNFKEIIEKQIEINNKARKWEYLQFDYPKVGIHFVNNWHKSVKLYYSLHIKNKNLLIKLLYLFKTSFKYLAIWTVSLIEAFQNKLYLKTKNGGTVISYRAVYLAGAYILTKEGANKLLKLENKIVFAADRIHNQARLKGLAHRIYVPQVIHQDWESFGSSIQLLTAEELKKEK